MVVSEAEMGQLFGSMLSRDRFFSPVVHSVQKSTCPVSSAAKAVHLVVLRVILTSSGFVICGRVAFWTKLVL